jgi:RNA recognition motif-containing protein
MRALSGQKLLHEPTEFETASKRTETVDNSTSFSRIFLLIMSDAARWKATVFVGGLSPVVTSTHLLDAFIPFGEIVEVQLPKPDSRKSTDPHRGFAYVEFEDPEDAKEAIDNMDQSEFFGKILKVSQAKAPKSADEGLGSKKAVWEQVCFFTNTPLDRSIPMLNFAHRRVGWQSMPQMNKMETWKARNPMQMVPQMTLCRVWKDWM